MDFYLQRVGLAPLLVFQAEYLVVVNNEFEEFLSLLLTLKAPACQSVTLLPPRFCLYLPDLCDWQYGPIIVSVMSVG